MSDKPIPILRFPFTPQRVARTKKFVPGLRPVGWGSTPRVPSPFSSVPLYLCALVPLLLITSCTLGPDYTRPLNPANPTAAYLNTSPDDQNELEPQINQPWWLNFNDPVTTQLVEQALAHNTNIKAAAATVAQAHALLTQSTGRRLPELDLFYNADRSKISFNAPFGRTAFTSTTHAAGFSVRYITDLFGLLKRTEEADTANLLAAQHNLLALKHTTIALVVKSRIQIASLQNQLDIANQNTKNWQTTLNILDRRYRNGLTTPLDLRQVRENLARSQAAQPQIELQLKLALHALDLLLGRIPTYTDSLAQTLPDLPNLRQPPVGLPIALLERRPDLRRAEFQLKEATARVGVNLAQMYPDLTLSANIGYRSDNLSQLILSDSSVYSTALNLLSPIFKGSQIQGRVNQAKALTDQRAAEYAWAILNAIKEVEDALITEQMLRKRLHALTTRLDEALAAESLARDRYFQGLEPIVTVLQTERSRRNARNDLTTTKANLWLTRVDLLLALGGDWNTHQTSPDRKGVGKQTSRRVPPPNSFGGADISKGKIRYARQSSKRITHP